MSSLPFLWPSSPTQAVTSAFFIFMRVPQKDAGQIARGAFAGGVPAARGRLRAWGVSLAILAAFETANASNVYETAWLIT